MSDDATSNVTPYEFNAEQSKLIGGLGRSMRIVGLVGLAWAVVGIISMGIWALSGGTSFINVATTQGNDIVHLMDALGKLRNIFSLVAILIVAALVIALAVIAYVLIFHPAGASLVVNGHAIA